MSKISKGQNYSEKSVFFCKKVDPEYLGREIYTDEVKTPYTFYLVRKLDMGKDYRSLSEGEGFASLIQENFAKQEENFSDIVLKKVYVYVETNSLYYTLQLGSFQPTRIEMRKALKEWFSKLRLTKKTPLIKNESETQLTTNQSDTKKMMKQMIETSNEMFRLKKMIHELNDNIGHLTQEMTHSRQNPVISRSIRTVHLKRAQPLVLEDSKLEKKSIEDDTVLIEETSNEFEEPKKVVEKKPQVGKELKRKQEDIPPTDETTVSKSTKRKPLLNEVTKQKDLKKISDPLIKPKSQVTFRLQKSQYLYSVKNWADFYQAQKRQPKRQLVQEDYSDSQGRVAFTEMEDEIFMCFVHKKNRGTNKKKNDSKISVPRAEILEKVIQAEYLTYSWGQVFSQRKQDVLICNRLSCSNIIRELDDFLSKMREIAYSRTFISKKVRCSQSDIKKLNGYILLDKYMKMLTNQENE